MTDVSKLSEHDRQLLRATRVITKALAGAINQSRPELNARYGEDIAAEAIIGAVCLNAHAAAKLAAGETLDDLTDDTLLQMVRAIAAVE